MIQKQTSSSVHKQLQTPTQGANSSQEYPPLYDQESLHLSSNWNQSPIDGNSRTLRTTFIERWAPPSIVDLERYYTLNEKVRLGSESVPQSLASSSPLALQQRLFNKRANKEVQANVLQSYRQPWSQPSTATETEPDSPVPIYIISPTQRRQQDIVWGWPWLDAQSLSSQEYHRVAVPNENAQDLEDNGFGCE